MAQVRFLTVGMPPVAVWRLLHGDVPMSDDTEIMTDPGFWIAIAVGLSPIIVGGFVILWVQQ